SLRLIGIKYSETETNLLVYYLPERATPPFMDKTYGGFPIIGFDIYKEEVERGFAEIWGWAPKKNPPEEGREFKIYATLDVNGYRPQKDDDPDYIKKGCFPQGGDFAKTFKPLQWPDLNVVLTLEKIRSEKDYRMQNYLSADLYIEVRNIGNAPSNGVNILVEKLCPSRGNQRQTVAKKRIKGLKAGEKDVISVEIDNRGCHPFHDVYFKVTVDPDNTVPELDETNNVSQIKLKGRASKIIK
ncbi:MAG: CARDB domain-containing protein, partial [Candidatus Aminicenantia bacterium]